MKKKFTFLIAALMLLVFMAPNMVGWGQTYTLVSQLSELADGTYCIAAFNSNKYYTVPNTTINGQTFNCTEATYANNILTPAEGHGQFVFTAVSGVNNAFYIYNTNLNKYLVATGSKTFGYVANISSDYGYWTFSTVSSGGFSGVFSVQHSNKTHYMRAYNNSVRCYDGASNNGVYIFVQNAISGPTITELSYTGTPTTTTYEAGDSFDPTGLTVTATYSDASTQDVTASVVWTPDPLTQGTTSVTGTYSGLNVTVPGITVNAPAGPDIVLNYNNSPFTATGANTNTETVTLDDIEYASFAGYKFNGSAGNFISISRDQQGYLGNNTQLCGNIKKIVVDYYNGNASWFTMYEGSTALPETTTVSPSGTGTGSITYTFSGNNGYFKFKRTTTGNTYNDYCNINSISIYLKDCDNPEITVSTNSLTGFTYVQGNGPSAAQTFTVSGAHLTADLNLSLGQNSDFEISQSENNGYANSIDLTPSDGTVANTTIYARMKVGKAVGDYSGTITLTSTDATNKTVSLSGTVTTPTHALDLYSNNITGGSISFSPTSPIPEGETVTLTATPNEGYDFGAWVFYKEGTTDIEVDNSITVTNNQFTMPQYDLWVDATFTAKPTHAITLDYDDNVAAMEASPSPAYAGQTVTLTIIPVEGYYLESVAATYVDDNSETQNLTISNNNTFVMPNYNVTVTATFIYNVFEGTFALFSGTLTEGDYILVYDGSAMKNTVTNSKFDATNDFSISGTIITNPSKDIVWHIATSATNGYWTIKNDKINQYANQTGNAFGSGNTNVSLVDTPYDGAKWSHVENTSYDFRSKLNEGQSTTRYLRTTGTGFGTYATNNGGALTLYKYRAPHTITFNGNGGTYNVASTYTQTVYDGIATNLNANQFTKANAAFAGWATTADGDVVYANEASVTLTADLTLYAKWAEQCTVTYSTNGHETTQTVAKGTAIGTLPGADENYIPAGYTFKGWYNGAYALSDDEPTYVQSSMVVNNDVTLNAVFAIGTNSEGTESASLEIVPTDFKDSYANSNGEHTKSDVTFTTSNVYQASSTKIQFKTKTGYLYNNTSLDITSVVLTNILQGSFTVYSGQNEHPTTGSITGENNVYTITDASHKYITVKAGDNTPQVGKITINYNKPITITTYSNYCTSVTDITENKNIDNEGKLTDDITISSGALSIESPITIPNGMTLTVNGTGVIANDDPANLIIEEGGQLIIPNNATVAATFIKNVPETAGDKDGTVEVTGWTLISSPTYNVPNDGNPYENFSAVNNLEDASGYLLYKYDEEYRMWRSSQTTNHTYNTLNVGQGYLYGNNSGTAIEFTGNVNSAASYSVALSYNTKTTDNLAGFNLIGNPYAENISTTDITFVKNEVNVYPAGGYVLKNDGTWNAKVASLFEPNSGFLVQIDDAGYTAVIRKPVHGSKATLANNDYISFTVANSQYEDVTYAWFGKSIPLNKINHRNDEIPMLYIPQNGENYAIAMMDDNTNAFNLNFEAKTTGNYTLRFKANGEFNYLHVIDRLTGEDIDMLVEGEYSFVGSPRDNANRFIVRLGYLPNYSDNGEDIFAYQNGNDIVVSGEGELQIFDVMGRMVATQRISGIVTMNVKSQGVYIFRLNGKTQKIVVR